MTQDVHGPKAHVTNSGAISENFYLRHAGNKGCPLASDHKMVEVYLVRANGTPALAGQYLADMVPDLTPPTKLFVSVGCQFTVRRCR